MSYEVTATRRRPQAFDALAGQEFVAETLKNSIQSKKIAHAYLFSGPRGCGKTSTARILAKALNCANGPTATPCGKCQQCLEITKGQSTDVIEIDGASNTSVNDIRQIKDEVLFPPQSSRYKIYIIDEVHMLSTSAFNALLKTIEEPPAYCIFIFATTELHKVPATIKSRCQQFNFRLVPIERVKIELAEAAKEIGIQADDEALYWVARESTGSMRDAYTLFDQVAAFSGDHITYEKIKDKLGLVGIENLNEIFEAAAKNESENVLLKIDEFLQNGISIEQFITNCTEYLRSLLLIKAGISKESLLGHPKERFSETVLNSWNSIQTERALSILLQLFRDIRYSLSPRYELELAFSKISWLTQYVSPSEVKKAIDEAKALLLNAEKLKTANSPAGDTSAERNPYERQTVSANFFAARQKNAQNFTQQNPFAQQAQNGKPAPNIFATAQNQNHFSGESAPQQNSFSQAEKGRAASSATSAANPYIGKTVSVPKNIFARPEQAPQAQSVQNSAPQAQNSAEYSGNLTEDFAPPDPTPDTPQSFLNGGAEPPEQTENTGDSVPASDFRGQILKELSMREPLLASSLYQTGEWRKNGNTVSTTVQSSFLKMQLDANLKKISGVLSSYFSEQVSFQVIFHEKKQENRAENAPEQIKMLCEMFRGQIIGHSKKTGQEIAQTKQEKYSESEADSEQETSSSFTNDAPPPDDDDDE